MDTPFKSGILVPRWAQAIHCMLQKKPEPFANCFRNIQLYEGDFSGALKLIVGRRLMRHANEHQSNSDETYGGRKGRKCHELLAPIVHIGIQQDHEKTNSVTRRGRQRLLR